jgi:hypothetical protein
LGHQQVVLNFGSVHANLIIYAGEDFQLYMLDLINNIILQYAIPELIKVELLSPIYKNKGDKNDSKNDDGGIKWRCIYCKTSLQWRLLLCQYCPEVVSCYMF